MDIPLKDLDRLIEIFTDLTGIRYTREKRYLFENRLAKFFGENREFHSYRDLIDSLATDKDIQDEFINALTTNYTYFFREQVHFRFISYICEKKFKKERELRIWSAAASGGHEAYSIAISLLGSQKTKNFKILGTDIATDKIEFAKKGLYKKEEVDGYLNKKSIYDFFDSTPDGYTIKKFVKKHITFAPLNIMGDYPFKKSFHIVFLRNILIYFKPDEKEIILKKIADYIVPSGYLIISLSESLTGLNVPFDHVKSGIYKLTSQKHILK